MPDSNGMMGNVIFRQSFPKDDPAVVESEIRAIAGELGLRVQSVDVLTALQPAPAVVFVSDDPASFLKQEDVADRLFGSPPNPKYEGFFLEGRDGSGETFLAIGASFRSGISQSWIRPDLAPSRGP